MLRYTKLLNVLYTVLLLFVRWKKKKSVGEVVVDRTNYRGCQFDEHLIQCETSTDISRIMNEFVYVQNYF